LYQPSQIFVEKAALRLPTTQNILSRLSNLQPFIIDDLSQFTTSQRLTQPDANPNAKPLILAVQKAEFLKNCPGTRRYICCGYQILNLINNCEINCSYCILQGYLNNPFIIVYVNIEDLFAECEAKLRKNPDKIFRIGTGELADSLSTDHLTRYSKALVRFFNDKNNAVIELKTKTTLIDNFIKEQHNRRTVIAWSLNTPKIIASEESFAPTLEQRLAAAARCQTAGFKLAFHFDPMIYYNEWEDDYQGVVEKLFAQIDPENIIWISLGALRYPPQLEKIIRNNHPHSSIVLGELFPGLDEKIRYFKPIRIEMFRKMYQWIKAMAPDVFVYLCMESSEVWEKAFGWTPKNSAKLKRLMDKLVDSINANQKN